MENPSAELKLHFLDYLRILRIRLPFIVLIFFTVVILAGVATYISPKKYESAATMEIRRSDYFMRIFGGKTNDRADPRFLMTQSEIIQRKEMLAPVVQKLDLVKRWSADGITNPDQAYARLKGMISLSDVRNTDLVEVKAEGLDPKEAAEIANAVTARYIENRKQVVEEWVTKSLSSIEEEVRERRAEAKALQAKAEAVRAKYGIIDLLGDDVEASVQPGKQTYIETEQKVAAEKIRISGMADRLKELDKLSAEQIMLGSNTLQIQDPTINRILPLYQQAHATETRLLHSGLGPNHPQVRSSTAERELYYNQLIDQIQSLRKSLEANLTLARSSLASMEGQLEGLRTDQQLDREQEAEYIDIKNEYIRAKQLRDAAETRIATERMQYGMPMDPARIWEYAEPRFRPVSPNILFNMIFGVLGGIVLGIGFAFFMEYMDTSVKTLEEIEAYLQVPVLAIVPKDIHLLLNAGDDCVDAEAYRILRTNIEFNRRSAEANSITVVSGGAGEGKSTTICNLAYIFARGGYNTLVVDADLRRPSQHRLFKVENDRGITDYLSGQMSVEEVVRTTDVENLYFISSGPQARDAVGLLNSKQTRSLLSELKTRFDIVLIDSPPILGVSDGAILASFVDLTMLIVQHRRFPRSMLKRVKQAVLNAGGKIVGVVLNNVDVRHDRQYEYYTGYYSYYAENSDGSGKTKKRKKHKPYAGSPVGEEDKGSRESKPVYQDEEY
ncbi:MAG: GumC family protein [Chthoniobacterales bacterium]